MKAKLLNKSNNVLVIETESNIDIPDGDLDIEIKRYKEKRSLDANAYMWALLRKQALARNNRQMTVTNWDCYLESLKRYGQFTYIVLKPKAVENFKKNWRECEELGEITINGEVGIQLKCYFGSSSYTTEEFSALLNGIIEDCKELGIDTATPDEVAHMIELFDKKSTISKMETTTERNK